MARAIQATASSLAHMPANAKIAAKQRRPVPYPAPGAAQSMAISEL
jgi:hypothetical protein